MLQYCVQFTTSIAKGIGPISDMAYDILIDGVVIKLGHMFHSAKDGSLNTALNFFQSFKYFGAPLDIKPVVLFDAVKWHYLKHVQD